MAIEACTTTTAPAIVPDWREGLPVIRGDGITPRGLRLSDAVSMLSLLTAEEVTRFISPPPTTLEGFERFIRWTRHEREAGRYACFAAVPDGYDTAIGSSRFDSSIDRFTRRSGAS